MYLRMILLMNPYPFFNKLAAKKFKHQAYARFEVIVVNCEDYSILGRDTA